MAFPLIFSSIFDMSQASSLQSPFSLIPSLNTSLHLFLGLSFTPSPSVSCSVSTLFIQLNSCTQLISPLNMAKPPQPVSSHDFSNVINCQHASSPTHCFSFYLNSLLPSISTSSFLWFILLCIFLISSTFVVSLPYNIAGLMHVV